MILFQFLSSENQPWLKAQQKYSLGWEVCALGKTYTDAFFFISLNGKKVPKLSVKPVHFCVLYSTAFSSKSQVPMKSRQCICAGLYWSLCYLPSWLLPLKLHHSGSHPVSSKIWGYLQKLQWDSWCQKCAPWQQCKTDPTMQDCSPSTPRLHSIASTTALQRGL